MMIGPEPIFKNNLLLADISSGESCSILLVFKVWARNLSNSRHHPAMSCKKLFISLPTRSVFEIRFCRSYVPPSLSILLNDRRNVFGLVFKNVADPIQEFPRNPDDRLGFLHPFAVLIEGLHHCRIFTHGNPRSFHQQPSQVRVTSLGHPSDMLLFAAALNVWNQSHIRTQLIQGGEPINLTQFQQHDHGGQRTNPWNGSQQAHPTLVLFRSGQGQNGTVQLGNDLTQVAEFFHVNLKSHIPAGSLHPNSLDPSDKSSRPMPHLPLLWDVHPVKKKHRFDLVFAPPLLPTHAQAGPDQTAILQLPPRRDIDSLDITTAETPGQFTAIDSIPFVPSLLVLGRYVSRVGHDILDPFFPQLIMNPKPTIARFVDRKVLATRKVMLEVLHQCFRFRRLAKAFILTLFSKNADTPAFFVHIQPDVNRLTREIKFATLIHGKSPFLRLDFVANKIIAEIRDLPLFFSDPLKGTLPLRELSTGG